MRRDSRGRFTNDVPNPFLGDFARNFSLSLTNYRPPSSDLLWTEEKFVGEQRIALSMFHHPDRETLKRNLISMMLAAQGALAPALFDAIMHRGRAIVELSRYSMDDSVLPCTHRLGVEAKVSSLATPAMFQVTYPIEVSSHTFYPRDWQCVYCGCWNSGTKTPYACPKCAAPRRMQK